MTSYDQNSISALHSAITTRAGGYLRNPLRAPGLTCAACTTPSNGFKYCFQCNQHRQIPGVADTAGFLTYAIARRQSGYMMRGYKAPIPVQKHRTVVAMLVYIGLAFHRECVEGLLGAPVTHWSSVPSLPARVDEHPLHAIVGDFIRIGPLSHTLEAPLCSATAVDNSRSVRADHYSTQATLPSDSHVLLVEDTWVSGGHAQSAALTLRQAGAGRVSILAIARWLRPPDATERDRHRELLRQISSLDYEPAACPWPTQRCVLAP